MLFYGKILNNEFKNACVGWGIKADYIKGYFHLLLIDHRKIWGVCINFKNFLRDGVTSIGSGSNMLLVPIKTAHSAAKRGQNY